MSCTVDSFPPEVTLYVLSFLDTKSLSKASQTCKKWYDFIYNTDDLWRSKCRALDYDEIKQDIRQGLLWRDIFIKNYTTNAIKKSWLEGKCMNVKSPDELPKNLFGPFNTETWGQILEVVQTLS